MVYSFDGDTAEGYSEELQFLAGIADQSVKQLNRNIRDLYERGLVQQRGKWRAVLPHALANKLAKRAISHLSTGILLDIFLNSTDRLRRSFSRRLGYLANHEGATNIASNWLDRLGTLMHLDRRDHEILSNLVPIVPDLVLHKIEGEAESFPQFCTRNNPYFSEWTDLLISLAYDADLFGRCAHVLCRFALSEHPDENVNSVGSRFKVLFQIQLSGTHASAKVRHNFFRSLICSDDTRKRQLGLQLFESALTSARFTGNAIKDFGVALRDYGYRPKNREDVVGWYTPLMNLVVEMSATDNHMSRRLRTLLGWYSGGLCKYRSLHRELLTTARQLLVHGPWIEGWLAAKRILRQEQKMIPEEQLVVINEMERLLEPEDLESQVRIYAINSQRDLLDLMEADEDVDQVSSRCSNISRTLGLAYGRDPNRLLGIMDELVRSGNPDLEYFGRGVVEGAFDLRRIWKIVEAELLRTGPESCQCTVILGGAKFLEQNMPRVLNVLLNYLAAHTELNVVFPDIQLNVIIDKKGLKRLMSFIQNSQVPIARYQYLPTARFENDPNDEKFAVVLRLLFDTSANLQFCFERLYWKLNRIKDIDSRRSLKNLGFFMLSAINFNGRDSDQPPDNRISKVVRITADVRRTKVMAKICERILRSMIGGRCVSVDSHEELLRTLAACYPLLFLDCFVLPSGNKEHFSLTGSFKDAHTCIIAEIEEEVLLAWCSKHGQEAFENVAYHMHAFVSIGGNHYGWNPVIMRLLLLAEQPIRVLDSLSHQFYPTSYDGKRSDRMIEILELLPGLLEVGGHDCTERVKEEMIKLKDKIVETSNWEKTISGFQNRQGFE